MKPAPSIQARRARWAVLALFFTNGALFANVVPRYPEIKDTFGLSDPIYGVTIALFPLGAMIAGPFAGWLIRRFTSARTAAWGTVAVGALLVGAGVCAVLRIGVAAGSSAALLAYVGFALFFLMAGGADSVTDVGQNAHGLRVQRLYGRSIFTSYHGGWSLGAVTGGLMGSAATALKVPLFAHLIVSAMIFMVVGLLALRFTLPGSDHQDVVAENENAAGQGHFDLESGSKDREVAAIFSGADKQAEGDSSAHSSDQTRHALAQKSVPTMPWPTGVVLALLTLVMISGMGVEDIGSSWSALYLRDYLGAAAGVAGMGFVVLLSAQAVGRFSADRVIDWLGPRAAVTLSALLVTGGGLLSFGIDESWALLVGMALVGLGSAAMVPTAMNAADDIPGLKAGTGLTVVTWLGRLAFLCAPPLVGLLVEATTLRWAIAMLPIYGLVALLTSRVLAPESKRKSCRHN